MTRSWIRRLAAVLCYFGFVSLVGAVGYVTIEGWGFRDALYMTAITITAVGYQEVHPLTAPGQTFTMGLLAGGVTGMGLWFALVTSTVVELDLRDTFRRRRTMNSVKKLRDHVIVCGAGRTGRQIVQEFEQVGQPLVFIERDPDRVKALQDEHPKAIALESDATHDHYLEQAGIHHAKGLISALNSDADNLFVCLSARVIRPDLMIVARAHEEETSAKMYRAGADHVVNPTVSGAINMASCFTRPSVVTFLDVATQSQGLDLRLERALIEPGSSLAGKTLAAAQIPRATGMIVIALRTGDEGQREVVFNPIANTELHAGDEMIVLGRADQLAKLRELT